MPQEKKKAPASRRAPRGRSTGPDRKLEAQIRSLRARAQVKARFAAGKGTAKIPGLRKKLRAEVAELNRQTRVLIARRR